ncbi:MAG TPA: prepilin-type N-terminal cleavage/methylation domain-containing protein [Candidatus Paceibacterota bacterium]|nr:prepilin-type N-terminal cleavage/methylation domain-containing protein [Candidatus Paceibacterota bacterium]
MQTARKQSLRLKRAFTLIEVLVVIGIIAILAGIVLVALNPGRQFATARNSERVSNTTTILNAVGQRIADNKGVFDGTFTVGTDTYTCPALTAGTEYDITSVAGAGKVDLSCLTPTYIPAALPFDPSAPGAHWTSAADYDTGYHVLMDSAGRYTVSAPSAELGEAISVTR